MDASSKAYCLEAAAAGIAKASNHQLGHWFWNETRSRPHPLLATTSFAVVVLAVVLPFTPLGTWFGFVPPSAAFLLAIAGLTVSYLLLAQGAKWAFYRLWRPVAAAPAPTIRAQLPLIGRS